MAAQTGPRFTIVQCAACAMAWTEPPVSAVDLEPYYAGHYWEPPKQEGARSGPVTRLQQWIIDVRLSRVLRPLLVRMHRGARVLDVGCGPGESLRHIIDAGCSAYGVETSPQAAAQAQRTGATVFAGTFVQARFEDDWFDGVAMIHVLEHVDDPVAALREAHRVLKPGGLLVIEVPNIESWGFALFGRRWRALDVPRHLYHFSPASLKPLLIREGFEIVRLSHFSARASAATWAGSMFTAMDPIRFRQREAAGRSTLVHKIAYLFLQAAFLTCALEGSAVRRGDVISVLARKTAAAR